MRHEFMGQVQSESPPPARRQAWHAPILKEYAIADAEAISLGGAIDGAGGKYRYS